MCGIVGYIGNRDCTDVLLDTLSKLEYRGYDSAGIAVFEKGSIKVKKSKGKLVNLVKKMDVEGRPSGHCGIGHTRWATHGEPSDINSHPHGNRRISIVHNGIIENYKELKELLKKEGYAFESETDTEVLAKLIDYYYNGDPVDTLINTLAHIDGSYGVGIVFRDFPDHIYAMRKDSPLILGTGENENFIASDIASILKYTRDYYLIEHGEICDITQNEIKVFDTHKNIIEKELHTATWDVDAAEKGGYEHFMLKEIHEQPSAVKLTLSPRIKNSLPDLSESGLTAEKLGSYENIYIIACGTAMHAAMVGKYVIEKLARVSVTVDIASEFRYRDPLINPTDLFIAISQSGETADTKAALHLAKDRGADTLAIVNVVGSSIAREADMVLYTNAGPEISVASTKAYSVQLAAMYLLAVELANVKKRITSEECAKLTENLLELPSLIEKCLETKEMCQLTASKLVNANSLLYIGRGLDYALSMEGSLKLKEISYIHSESYAAGELKHGTISLITDNMPVVAVATQRALIEKTVSNIEEVKARGAMVVLVCGESLEIEDKIVDYVIRLPETNEMFMPSLAAIPLQLIAYYTSVLKGNDVDQPRNLAKSVTVE
ncbi:MAG: glutamine--fructose-6-phosphate transaminase (isomerizing) [Firmicutes bacterium]|nr:glutamine--fructose-6-phosphate transaminase (isomerizing) [Bacillota bacterium]